MEDASLLMEEIEEEDVFFNNEEERLETDEIENIPINDSNPTTSNESLSMVTPKSSKTSPRKRTCRKLRVANTDNGNHKKIKNYQLREKGEMYMGVKKIQLNERGNKKWNWDYKVPKSGRTIAPRCQCKLSVKDNTSVQCTLLSEEHRLKLFSEFYKLSWSERKVFVCNNMDYSFTERARNRKDGVNTRRQYSYKFFLPCGEEKLRVCRTMFLNTLRIGRWSAQNWKLGKEDKISPTLNKKPKARVGMNERRKKCELFLDSLAKMESHYCRKDTSLLYLEPQWNSLAELYRTYVVETEKSDSCYVPVSQCLFEEIFHQKKLCIFKTRKDLCETCLSYQQKNLSEQEYRQHRALKEAAQNEKAQDKENKAIRVFTMDVQSVLLAPKNNSSSMYYKTKLISHNFTFYDLHSRDVMCYVWNETEANLQASTFASCISDFILNHTQCKRGDTLVFWSDGCTYQNRNVTLTNALLNVAIQAGIIIIQKYLVKGHTQMEVDSVHASVEANLRNRDVNLPSDYCSRIRESRAKNPYEVKYLGHTFFKSFENLQFFTSIRPAKDKSSQQQQDKVNDISVLKYCPSGEVFYKTRMNSTVYRQLKAVRTRTKQAIVPVPFDQLPRAYHGRLPISKKKYDHLQALLSVIPSDCHGFYKNLPFSSSVKEKYPKKDDE